MTIEGATHPLERPFIVLATQNPIEYEGTYPLPEAQLDRFLLRIGIGYPTPEDEWRHGRARASSGGTDEVGAAPVVDGPTLLAHAAARSSRCTSPRASGATWSTSSRRRGRARASQVGASPRGTLALLKLARGRAALAGPRLRHARGREGDRRAGARAPADAAAGAAGCSGSAGEDIVREMLDTVPTPPAEDVPRPADRATRDPAAAQARARRGSGAYAGLVRARPARRARRSAAPELVVLAAPFALLLAVGLVLGRAAAARALRARSTPSARSRATTIVATDRRPRRRRRSSGSRSCSRSRTGSQRPGHEPGHAPARGRRGAHARAARSTARAGAATPRARSTCAPATGSALSTLGGGRRPALAR